MRLRYTPVHQAFRRWHPGTDRGLALWLVSLYVIGQGLVNYLLTTTPAPTTGYLAFALEFLPAQAYGWAFVVVGLVCGWLSYCHRDSDQVGWFVVGVVATLWSLVYVTGLFDGAGLRTVGAGFQWMWIPGAAGYFLCRPKRFFAFAQSCQV